MSTLLDHPLRGSCVPGCELYGLCHCRCGRPTKIAESNKASWGYVKGRPRVYLCGHYPKRGPGMWRRNGVPVERLVPLVRWLYAHYSRTQAAEVTGVPLTTLDEIAYKLNCRRPDRMVSRISAQRICETVLAHRRATPGLFDELEEVHLPSAEARQRAQRERWAGAQRAARSRRRRAEAG